MIVQVNNEQRIIIEEHLQVNNSPLKLKLAFLNQEITSDPKNGYYKFLIWFVGSNFLEDFSFNLFLKFENTQVLIPLENLQNSFQPNDQNFLVAKIPSKIFNPEFNELTYTLAHDGLFKGEGNIFLNLRNDSTWEINNELLFYENNKSFNLITRKLEWEIPDFSFNEHYKKILGFKYETKDNSFKVNLLPIQEMANLVRNNTWTTPFAFQSLKIETRTFATKRYDFTPNYEISEKNNSFKLNLLNHLYLNSEGQIIDGGLNEATGLLINPLIAEQQLVKINVKAFNLIQEFSFWIKLPKLSLSSHFQGEWVEFKTKNFK